jgi:NAD(P)-dependent dehydrogenase (short-subunit alcohol dehydrogenase family)
VTSSRVEFKDCVAIVTGGGRNLGRRYCLDLAERGAAVVVNDIDRAAANATVEEIFRSGGSAVASYESVASKDGGAAIVETAVESFGTVDILVNNAGNVHAGPFARMALKDFQDVLNVHLTGAFCVTQPAWAIMQAKGYGRIVMSGSAAGVYPEQGYSEYATAKAGIVGMTLALAAEGREHGILVNAIHPQAGGSTMTDSAKPIPKVIRAGENIAPDEALAPYKSAEAISPLVLYLCSQHCDQTGLILAAGAGWFGRVFAGLTSGWVAGEPGAGPSIEEVAMHVEQIVDARDYIIPSGASHELRHIATRIGIMSI